MSGGFILIVDDEPVVRMLIVDVLEEQGHTVIEAGEGQAALGLMGSSAVDLLITDVGLPGGMNGRTLAEEARKLKPGLKVLFITGYSDGDLGATSNNATQMMSKPFSMEALGAKVSEMLAAD